MYTSLHVKGFRCFRDLKIEKLARINLIGGKNNTGKTALLEAVRIHAEGASSPESVLLDLYRQRGLDWAGTAALRFRDLLTDFPEAGTATIVAPQLEDGIVVDGRPLWTAEVQLSVARAEVPASRKTPEPEGPSPASRVEVKRDGKHTGHVLLTAQGRVTASDAAQARRVPCLALPSREHPARALLADLFAVVQVERREGLAVDALKHVEPRLRDLEMVVLGGVPLLHADLGGSRRVPLPVVGEGMSRVCAVMLAACNVPGGILLIDEIENGLHYSVMPKVWAAVAEAARELDVQVFATTHSRECLDAALEAIGDNEGELLYHRLHRTDDTVGCVTYTPELLREAVEMPWEVR